MSMGIRWQMVATLGLVVTMAGLVSAEDLRITKGPVVEGAAENSAIVAWSTNASSSTLVKYGTDPNNLNQSAQTPWGSLTHRVTIKNLEPGRKYYFQVSSGQAQGTSTTATSEIRSFSTKGTPAMANAQESNKNQFQITQGPVLERVGDRSAIVAWSTNLPSSSIVKYGTAPNHLSEIAQEPWGATAHRVELKNLQPGVRYFFMVHSAQGQNAPGQKAEAGPISFTTANQGQEASAKSQ
jgi:phosphodiesterase/alkaline phosphatase D-like protein